MKQIEQYFIGLQSQICDTLEGIETSIFVQDHWQKENNQGYGRTHILTNGNIFEQAGVNFSLIRGQNMPKSATEIRSELAGRDYQAMGVSLVLHPDNPFIPTVHMNVRFFCANANDKEPIWWFGGGYDLTPYYGFEEDCIHWHQNAKQACEPFGENLYSKYKKWCDKYFYLKHRHEPRGIGGLFFDDLTGNFDECFNFIQSVGNSFLTGYLPIVKKRQNTSFTQANKDWQAYRRGRYVEFNLVYDRGTLFGLQSGGRTESILMSLPPVVHWQYQQKPKENSAEAKLYTDFLTLKNWL